MYNPFKPDHVPWFDHFLIASDVPTSQFADTVVREIIDTETRARRRSDAALATLTLIVDNIVSNLLRRSKYPVGGSDRVPVSRRKQLPPKRYRSKTHSETFRSVLDKLDRLDYINQEIGDYFANQSTLISSGLKLKEHLESLFVDPKFTRMPGQEIVVLKSDKARFEAAQLVDYKDDDHTKMLRAQMKTINEFIESLEIEYTGSGLVDTDDRFMRRIYNRESFDCGGRLAGGFWMYNKGCRKQLKVEGERLMQIDFASMLPSLALAEVGKELTSDAYDIPDYSRKAVKTLMLSMLNMKSRAGGWPKRVDKLFPQGTRAADAKRRIEESLPALAGLWYQDRGVYLMNTESNILVGVLMVLVNANIPALPIHDCVLVPESGVEFAKEVMLASFNFHTQQRGTVTVDKP